MQGARRGLCAAIGVASGFFRAVEAGRVKLAWIYPETAMPTRRIVSLLLWLFALGYETPWRQVLFNAHGVRILSPNFESEPPALLARSEA